MKALKQGLVSTQTTPLNRLVGLTIGIITAPGAIFGTLMALYGMVTVFLIIPILLLYIPGMKLYIDAWKIYLDRKTEQQAYATWKWTIIYNLVMMAGVIAWWLSMPDFEFFLGALPGQMAVAFLAAVAIRDLRENGLHRSTEEEAQKEVAQVPNAQEEESEEPLQQVFA